jgi:hypothetical protein
MWVVRAVITAYARQARRRTPIVAAGVAAGVSVQPDRFRTTDMRASALNA